MKKYMRVKYLIKFESQVSDYKSVHYLAIKESVLFQSIFSYFIQYDVIMRPLG